MQTYHFPVFTIWFVNNTTNKNEVSWQYMSVHGRGCDVSIYKRVRLIRITIGRRFHVLQFQQLDKMRNY